MAFVFSRALTYQVEVKREEDHEAQKELISLGAKIASF